MTLPLPAEIQRMGQFVEGWGQEMKLEHRAVFKYLHVSSNRKREYLLMKLKQPAGAEGGKGCCKQGSNQVLAHFRGRGALVGEVGFLQLTAKTNRELLVHTGSLAIEGPTSTLAALLAVTGPRSTT